MYVVLYLYRIYTYVKKSSVLVLGDCRKQVGRCNSECPGRTIINSSAVGTHDDDSNDFNDDDDDLNANSQHGGKATVRRRAQDVMCLLRRDRREALVLCTLPTERLL